MRTVLFAAVVAVLATAAPAAEIDWKSPDIFTVDADEVDELLPPGEWCLILSVHNNPGEARTLTYRRGTDCDPEDRVIVEPPALGGPR
jgi:hypothetical protein